MPDQRYELDYTRSEENGHHLIIAILTGMPIEDIVAVSPTRDSWYSRDYINVFRDLKFNCNPRFIKFNPDTEYPCMMRFIYKRDTKICWYAWAYYNGKVYFGNGEWWRFDDYIKIEPNIRVTSMLQVWI